MSQTATTLSDAILESRNEHPDKDQLAFLLYLTAAQALGPASVLCKSRDQDWLKVAAIAMRLWLEGTPGKLDQSWHTAAFVLGVRAGELLKQEGSS